MILLLRFRTYIRKMQKPNMPAAIQAFGQLKLSLEEKFTLYMCLSILTLNNMFLRLIAILLIIGTKPHSGAKIQQQSFDDAIMNLRKSANLAPFVPQTSLTQNTQSSLIESESLKKPLTVAQFSEWLHNLYFNEKEKRDSAIKSLLANDPLRAEANLPTTYS